MEFREKSIVQYKIYHKNKLFLKIRGLRRLYIWVKISWGED